MIIDLASARIETYSAPGENPTIKYGSLEEDLSRRDFTINAIAIELEKGKLIDPFEGRKAMAKRELNFLHHESVGDDPTRVI